MISRPPIKKPANLKNAEPECEHDWKRFKQTIQADNPKFKFRPTGSYFIIKGCTKCKTKNYISYVLNKE